MNPDFLEQAKNHPVNALIAVHEQNAALEERVAALEAKLTPTEPAPAEGGAPTGA